VGYLRVHRGQRFASTTAVTPMTEAFVRNIDQFINHESVDLVDSLCTPPECCGEQHRCAKPGSHSRQNPVPGLASRAFRIDQESGAVVVLGRKYRSSAKARPRPVPIAEASAVPAPPHGCDRTSASRSCVHRCRRFPVVGSGRRAIHVLVFFQVSHGSAPRLDANMGANGEWDINPGLTSSDNSAGKLGKTLTCGPLFQVILSGAEAADQEMGGNCPTHGQNRAGHRIATFHALQVRQGPVEN
jgi:hypothetical protein